MAELALQTRPPAEQVRPEPFRALFDAEFAYVWHALRRCGVADAELEDITQEVFLRVYRHLGDYDPARPLRPWLFGFVVRVAKDWRKLARNRHPMLSAIEGVADGAPSADEQLVLKDKRALVDAALRTLDLDFRALFVLHEIEGYPVPEIAEALSLPVFTAYSRLRVARERFAAAARRLKLQRGES